ncbi:MAG: peptidylprolyl isomerase [Zymomonas mobilis]|uniref:Peptidyl-prolyl cis-trans isomerase n=1 Tax=Zymomonas mobilis TaxID=542 RepID=A0A542W111_ZYMMB|nr:peptidylprolyl isomerase [Zymomonas mobilis]TQL17275.1 peptidylprolyl isomerase [Zymomonas mobilis]
MRRKGILKSTSAIFVFFLLAAPLLAQKHGKEKDPDLTATPQEIRKVVQKTQRQALPDLPPIPEMIPENTLNLDLSTGGRVVIQLRPDKAPKSVERIKTLVRKGFYNGLKFHRVIDGFMAQTGDPKGDGSGGSSLPNVQAEFNDMPHVRGEVSMARAQDKDSANSQFFIVYQPNFSLDGEYTPIGRVVSGMEYVDAVEKGEPPAHPSLIVRASIGADKIRPPKEEEVKAAIEKQEAANRIEQQKQEEELQRNAMRKLIAKSHASGGEQPEAQQPQ